MKKSKSRNTRIAKKKFARKVSSKQKKSLVQKTSQNVVQFPKNHTEIQKINHALSVGAENKKNPAHMEGFIEFAVSEILTVKNAVSDEKGSEINVPNEFFHLMTSIADKLLMLVKEDYVVQNGDTPDAPAEEVASYYISAAAQKVGSLVLQNIKLSLPTPTLKTIEQLLGVQLLQTLLKGAYQFEIQTPELCILDTETGAVTDMDGNAVKKNAFTHDPTTGEFISIN